MTQEKFLIAMSTSILTKMVKGFELTNYDKQFLEGIKEGFDELDEEGKKYFLMFSDIHEATMVKSQGKMN